MLTTFLRLSYFLTLFFFANSAAAQTIIDVQNANLPKYLGEYTQILEDKNGQLTLQDILMPQNQQLFKQSTQEVPNFQITPFTYWLKLQIQSNKEQNLLLEIDKGDIDSLSFFQLQKDTTPIVTHTGQLVPFKTRLYQVHQFIIPISLPQNEIQTCYIRVKSAKPLAVPIVMNEPHAIIWLLYKQTIAQGIYFGFTLLIILYNLFIWFSVRDRIYLIYVAYVAMLSIVLADFKGITASLVFVKFENFNPYTIAVYGIAGSLADIFSIYFLNTKHYAPKNHRVILSFVALYLVATVLGFVGFRLTSCLITNLVAFVSSGYLLYTAWIIYKKGFKPAKYYLYAFGSFLFCVLAQFGGNLGLLPANVFTLQAMQFGSAAEMLLLSFALADKINSLKAEKDQAKLDLLEIVQQQNVILEQKVHQRTQELAENNAILETQNEEIRQQHEELMMINESLEEQRETTQRQKEIIGNTLSKLQDTTQRLNASIDYAKRIQQVILPDNQLINSFFSSHFTIYKPKDVVSGDFYWFTFLAENKALFALADCTGHGVSGAFMTMVCNALLYETVEIAKIEKPAEILKNLHIRIQKILRQHEGKNSDGLDISLCWFEKQNDQSMHVNFSGINSYIYYVKTDVEKQESNGSSNNTIPNTELIKLASGRGYIGGNRSHEINFITHSFILAKGQMLYFSTDGYTDQNDLQRNRLGLQTLNKTLSEIYHLPIENQKDVLLSVLENHQKDEIQRDDISVVGILV